MGFDVDSFCEKHKNKTIFPLASNVKVVLEEIANRNQIAESAVYKKVINTLFPASGMSFTACALNTKLS